RRWRWIFGRRRSRTFLAGRRSEHRSDRWALRRSSSHRVLRLEMVERTMSLSPSDRVLLVGDSLAVGLTKQMQALADLSSIAFKGHGVVGSRIDEWNKHYFSETLGDFAPTVIVVSLGTNDMKMFDPKTQQVGPTQSLLDKRRATGARVAWIIPPTMPFTDKGVRQMIEDAHPDLAIH